MSFAACREAYAELPLRAHALLADVPLHDVWTLDLPGGGPDRTIDDVRRVFSLEDLAGSNPAVRFLFALRRGLGALFGWDREAGGAPGVDPRSYRHRLSAEDRAQSTTAPGTREEPFTLLYTSRSEAISEIVNATVHAFLVFALVEETGGYRLYWAIYVAPVGRITRWYMRLIDPFRRFVIYPALLKAFRRAWQRADASLR